MEGVFFVKNESKPVSRVLFFRQPSILVRCCQRHHATFSRRNEQPHYLCLSCFGWGLQGPETLLPRRWALTPPFHPYQERAWRSISVALSLESPPPAVSRHPALRSPDFPHLCQARLSNLLTNRYYKSIHFSCQTLKQLPPTNSLIKELLGISRPGCARK